MKKYINNFKKEKVVKVKKNLIMVKIGILALSGMFLMGQEGWTPDDIRAITVASACESLISCGAQQTLSQCQNDLNSSFDQLDNECDTKLETFLLCYINQTCESAESECIDELFALESCQIEE